MKVFATAPLPGERFAALADDEELELTVHRGAQPIRRETLLAGVAGAHGLICLLTDPVDGGVLDAAGPQLKVVATCSVGVDHVDAAACAARGVTVTHTPGVLTETTADLTWALLLSTCRRTVEGDRLLRAGRFEGWRHDMLLGLELNGATLGIIGMGRIGRAVARRAVGFGLRVIYYTEGPAEPPVPPEWEAVDLDELLARADVVTLHVPLSAATYHLLDEPRLRAMKRGAYLINTSRGPVVDEAALATVLAEGHLAGAGLDVYEEEPTVHPALLPLQQVVLLPHLGSASVATRTRMADLAVAGTLDVLAGRPPTHVWDPRTP